MPRDRRGGQREARCDLPRGQLAFLQIAKNLPARGVGEGQEHSVHISQISEIAKRAQLRILASLMNIDVFKFGGVAVGSPEAIRAAVEHVRRAAPHVAVIVSAANGITDALLDTAQSALRGDRDAYLAAAQRFETRHLDLIAGVITNRARAEELKKSVAESANEMRSMAESIAVLRELTPRAQDALVARGERVMARIFTAVLREQNIAAEYVDAPDVVITERRLGSLWPNF